MTLVPPLTSGGGQLEIFSSGNYVGNIINVCFGSFSDHN